MLKSSRTVRIDTLAIVFQPHAVPILEFTTAIVRKRHRRASTAIAAEVNRNTLDEHMSDHYNDEVFSRRVPAGKRTYFFDVKTTRSGEDFFLTITESKRTGEASANWS